MSNQFLHMQKLAGLITESEYKIKLTEAENIVSKIDQNLNKVESLPAIKQAAEKIMDDPKLLNQFQQALSNMGVDLNLMKEDEGETIDSSDISKIVSAVQSQASQLKEDYQYELPAGASDEEKAEYMKKYPEAKKYQDVGQFAPIVVGLGLTSPYWLQLLPPDLITKVGEALGMSAYGGGMVIAGVATTIAAIATYMISRIPKYNVKKESKLNEGTLRNKIKEIIHSSLGEAKKKKKDEPEDVAPQDDSVDLDMGAEETDVNPDMDMAADTMAPDMSSEIDIDPKVKSIQDSLSKALANAKALGDEKLVNQIGNTITMLVRTQVVGQQVAESLDEMVGDLGKYDYVETALRHVWNMGTGNNTIDFEDMAKSIIDDLESRF
jgi:hypothetical protein